MTTPMNCALVGKWRIVEADLWSKVRVCPPVRDDRPALRLRHQPGPPHPKSTGRHLVCRGCRCRARRVRAGLRNPGFAPVNLDNIGAFNSSDVTPRTALEPVGEHLLGLWLRHVVAGRQIGDEVSAAGTMVVAERPSGFPSGLDLLQDFGRFVRCQHVVG